jgi:hypothetical protein
MLDLHSVYDATGSTDTIVVENNSNAVIPANDGATSIGLSPFANAVLMMYGAHTSAAAQALVALQLSGNNMVDPTNKLVDSVNTTPAMTSTVKAKFYTATYARGPNYVGYGQEAAGVVATFKMDLVGVGASSSPANFALQNLAEYSVASGACTAGVYKTTAFAPTNTPPIGRYRILGCRVYAVAFAAVIRFQHTDFQGAFPGFPVVSYGDQAITGANQGGNAITSDSWQGYQFVWLSQALGIPVCPEFAIQGQGTGLNIQVLDTAADTPQIDLILQKIA